MVRGIAVQSMAVTITPRGLQTLRPLGILFHVQERTGARKHNGDVLKLLSNVGVLNAFASSVEKMNALSISGLRVSDIALVLYPWMEQAG